MPQPVLPALPMIGSYISVQRPDKREPFGEDLIVRHVWWRLNHPETRGVDAEGRGKIGSVNEIFIECDPALGPYSSDTWRALLEGAQERGIDVEVLDVDRFSVREAI